jgi:NADH-quinone oxidoreductase subunit J
MMIDLLVFLALGALAAFAGAMVVLAKKAVYSALFLVANLFCVAVLYLSLSAEFLAAVQIIVYAGAIVILFLFVIMLLNPRAEEGASELRWQAPLAVAVGLLLLAQVGFAVSSVSGAALTAFPPTPVPWTDNVRMLGQLLFTEYALPFELTSVLLLIALVGATVLARGQAASSAKGGTGR